LDEKERLKQEKMAQMMAEFDPSVSRLLYREETDADQEICRVS
jgi:hypothetical protein